MEEQLQKRFETYYSQQAAINFQQIDPYARVFSYETEKLGGGRRHFICERPSEFVAFYQKFRSGRWFYELIQEDRPCRPYFDLEFYKKFNLQIDPLSCFNDFIEICKDVFSELLEIHLKDSNFLVLDSTTDEKFSAHVIVHLPNNFLFPNNVSLKPLISMICAKMRDSRTCIVMKENGNEDLLCDQAVYTKNRNFRLYYSSKYGKGAKLLHANYCKFYEKGKVPSHTQLFFDSLIMPDRIEHYHILDIKPMITKCQTLYGQSDFSTSARNFAKIYAGLAIQQSDQKVLAESIGPSPFSELEEFVLKLFKSICPSNDVKIRKWELVTNEITGAKRIDYHFHNCRFCWNIMREHKSQNIYLSFYFKTTECYQRCFDHECNGFSYLIIVPYQICEIVKRKFLELYPE